MAALQQIFLGYAATGGGGSAYPLDNISTSAYAAYSTARKLRSAYSGAVLSGYNGTNSADVGFSGSDIDLTALAARGTSVSLNTWYDQSGNANDFGFVQLNRPTIRTSSTNNVMSNSKVAWNMTANAKQVQAGAQNTSTCRTIVAAIKFSSLAATSTIVGAVNAGLQVRAETTGALGMVKQNTTYIGGSSSGDVTTGTAVVVAFQYDNSTKNYQMWKNGTSVATGTTSVSFSAGAMLLGMNNNGGAYNSEQYAGDIGELYVFDTSGPMNSTDLSTLVTDMRTYWGI